MLAQGEYLWAPGAWVESNGQEQILVHESHVALLLPVRVNKEGKHRTTEVSFRIGARCPRREVLPRSIEAPRLQSTRRQLRP
jgi:hypothetical protein